MEKSLLEVLFLNHYIYKELFYSNNHGDLGVAWLASGTVDPCGWVQIPQVTLTLIYY